VPRRAILFTLFTGCVFADWSPPQQPARPDATPADATPADATPDAAPACAQRAVRALVLSRNPYGCVVRCDGAVRCWGRNDLGQLGRGFTSPSESPGAVPALGEVTLMAAGFEHTCAWDGVLRCWGDNSFGMLGRGTREASPNPVAVMGLSPPVVSVAGGGSHTCAALDTGEVWCWGDNARGQLANSSSEMRARPTRAASLQGPAVEVVTGQYHTCARLRSGDVSCWGQATFGTLGDGTVTNRAAPGLVPLRAAAVDLASTDNHACVALDDGSAWCWGYNDQGQLGDATRTNRASPVPVAGVRDARLVATGRDHTCAALRDGSVRCWGGNGHGQLGDGTTTRRASPVTVVGLDAPAVAIAAGTAFTCAALEDGRVMCWGANDEGQLGVGVSDDHLTPVEVPLPR
jgi:alpha-tubulin suppressor-like RCC1 family protein